jgi:hypothetical protein
MFLSHVCGNAPIKKGRSPYCKNTVADAVRGRGDAVRGHTGIEHRLLGSIATPTAIEH